MWAVVQRRRGSRSEPISEDDLMRAISKLKVLGGGWAVTKVGHASDVVLEIRGCT